MDCARRLQWDKMGLNSALRVLRVETGLTVYSSLSVRLFGAERRYACVRWNTWEIHEPSKGWHSHTQCRLTWLHQIQTQASQSKPFHTSHAISYAMCAPSETPGDYWPPEPRTRHVGSWSLRGAISLKAKPKPKPLLGTRSIVDLRVKGFEN